MMKKTIKWLSTDMFVIITIHVTNYKNSIAPKKIISFNGNNTVRF